MPHPLEVAIVLKQCEDSQKRLAEADRNGEDIFAIASEENSKMLRAMEFGERASRLYVQANVEHAMDTAGILLFNLAEKSLDPNDTPELIAGVNAIVARVHRQAEAGVSIRMNYMDPATRKAVFLVESAMRGDALGKRVENAE